MFGLGAGELLVIFVFALLFIGPKKLPELAKSLGKSLREFQNAKDDFMNSMNEPSITDESQHENNNDRDFISPDDKTPLGHEQELEQAFGEQANDDEAQIVEDETNPSQKKDHD